MHRQELAISAVRVNALEWLEFAAEGSEKREAHWLKIHGDAALAAWLARYTPTHIYFGSEFCEHLLPSPRTLEQAIDYARANGLKFALLTPIASPDVLCRLSELLPLLPQGTEVVVNDWGVAALVAPYFPKLRLIAGRVLCRMTKDPRLGSDWAQQCSHNLDSPWLQALLRRLNIEKVEIDMPLFANATALSHVPLLQSVHLPYFCIAKGRMCRPGSLRIKGPERFAVGRPCHKECLTLSVATSRPGSDDAWETIQMGNTIFGRHSAAMLEALMTAVENGMIPRLVVSGESL